MDLRTQASNPVRSPREFGGKENPLRGHESELLRRCNDKAGREIRVLQIGAHDTGQLSLWLLENIATHPLATVTCYTETQNTCEDHTDFSNLLHNLDWYSNAGKFDLQLCDPLDGLQEDTSKYDLVFVQLPSDSPDWPQLVNLLRYRLALGATAILAVDHEPQRLRDVYRTLHAYEGVSGLVVPNSAGGTIAWMRNGPPAVRVTPGEPKLSFCTWIKDRLWQFRQTLPENIKRIEAYDAEIVIQDAGSSDGLLEWLQEYLATHPSNVPVRLHSVPTETLHFSQQLNRAFLRATGDILVNLDADNLLGEEYCSTVLRTMRRHTDVVHQAWSGIYRDGTFGRIAIPRKLFYRLGGYDERFVGCGAHDTDLLDRAIVLGARFVRSDESAVVGGAVRNTLDDKMQHLEGDGESWLAMNHANMRRSRRHIEEGRLVAPKRPACKPVKA